MPAGLVVVGVIGFILLIVVLADVLLTVFNYDGFAFLSARFHQLAWTALRRGSDVLPESGRDAVLRFGSAALLPATLAAWLVLEVSAFAFMFLPGMAAGLFKLGGHPPDLGTSFYLSAGAISSVVPGDIAPVSGVYQALTDLETIVGLATVGLAVTYVLTALDAVRSLNRLHARVRRQATEPNRPETIIASYYQSGHPGELSGLLQSFAEDLENYDQDLRRYPVVFYFHTQRIERSIPRVFASLGYLIELIRWGLPASEKATREPHLLAVADEYTTVLSRLQRSFVGPSHDPAPAPLPEPEFWDQYRLAGTPEAADRHISEFRALLEDACQAAGLDADPAAPGAQTYDRYEQWLAFHVRSHAIIQRVGVALGYSRHTADVSRPTRRFSAARRTRGTRGTGERSDSAA